MVFYTILLLWLYNTIIDIYWWILLCFGVEGSASGIFEVALLDGTSTVFAFKQVESVDVVVVFVSLTLN